MEFPKWRSVSIDLTEACNLACTYCFTQSCHKPRRMGWDMATRILAWWIPQLDKENPCTIDWWGGEPLIEYKLIQKLIPYANELAKTHNINLGYGGTTNGVLYTPDKVEWLAKNNSLMMVSLDGCEEANAARPFADGSSSWKIVDRNLREALKIIPHQRARASLSKANVHLFLETIKYFHEDLGLQHVAYSPVFEDDWDEESFEMMRDQFDQVIDYVVKETLAGRPFTIKHFHDGARYLDNFNPQAPCGAGRFYAGWSVDGYLFPCHRFNKHGLSSSERDKLDIILARPAFFGNGFEWVNKDFRKEFFIPNEGGTFAPKKCGECSIYCRSHCTGNCYAINYDLTGRIDDMPEKVCTFQHIQEQASRKLKQLFEENGIDMNGNKKGQLRCVCYGGCYSEGDNPIIHTNDGESDMSCGCYQTNYSGVDPIPFRTTREITDEMNSVIKALETVAGGAPKEPKQVIEKCVSILKKEHLKNGLGNED